MNGRSTLIAALGISACLCWAFLSMDASAATPDTAPRSDLRTVVSPHSDDPSQEKILLPSSRYFPIQRTMTPEPGHGADPRGGSYVCTYSPCDELVYDNLNGDLFGFAIDDITAREWDDIVLDPDVAHRHFCQLVFSVGGIANSGGTDMLTVTLNTGNRSPICPDDPASTLLFQQTVEIQLTNPFQTVGIEIDPPLLLNVDSLWVGMHVPDAATDASWAHGGEAEAGFSDDLFVIPNGDGVCSFGAGGDYFFYGGDPQASYSFQIRANPGDPGACCDRDTEDPMNPGNGTCTDSVLRADCVTGSTTAIWKEGLCAVFDNTSPMCTLCLSPTECEMSTPEDEPVCTDGYQDVSNAGCLETPFVFDDLVCGESYCGTSGNYKSHCTDDDECAGSAICTAGMFCENPAAPLTDSRDQDWWQITLTEDTEVSITLEPRFNATFDLMNNGGAPPAENCSFNTLEERSPAACSSANITRLLPPGTWHVRIRPDTFVGIPCGVQYRLSMTCTPMPGALTLVPCCDTSGTGCTDMAEVACTGRPFHFVNDTGPDCANVTTPCPGKPPNDDCLPPVAQQLSGQDVTVAFDSTFATAEDLVFHPGTEDVPLDCAVGEPADPNNPAIVADVFYTYTIPTTFDDEAIDSGELVISTIGSGYNTRVFVYGDPAAANTCTSPLCTKMQVACNDNIVFSPDTTIKFNAISHLTLDVEDGSAAFFDTGDCILIRVGGAGTGAASRGAGVLNVSFIPRGNADPYSLSTGRCCFANGTCDITVDEATCTGMGGFPRAITDFYEDEAASFDETAGCFTDPCPVAGEACYNALDFNAIEGDSGQITPDIRDVLFVKYVVPAGFGGIVIDSCDSAGFNDLIAVYDGTVPLLFDGSCNLGSLIAKVDDCTSTDSRAGGAQSFAPCFGGLNATFNSCLCLAVGAGADVQVGQTLYIALGDAGLLGIEGDLWPGSPRDVFDVDIDDLSAPDPVILTITTATSCFVCGASACPAGPTVIQEDTLSENVCQDNPNIGNPFDDYNGGCNENPFTGDPGIQAFNAPDVDCSLGTVTICGQAGNFRHGIFCEAPDECNASNSTCDIASNLCTGGASIVGRDHDWYKVLVPEPANLVIRSVGLEFPAEIVLFGDPEGDCDELFVFGADDTDFACDPTTGVPVELETSSSVCAGTYYLVIRPSIFGGLGDAECDSRYVVEVSCEPFVPVACCPADMNGDGLSDGLDIQKWIETLFTPPTVFDEFLGCFQPNFCRADANGDGLVEFADRDDFVDILLTNVPGERPECDLGASCTDPSTSQLDFDSTGATLSDLDPGSQQGRAAECICPLEDGTISEICWWGTYLNVDGLSCAVPDDDCFVINFYDTTASRCPGARICPTGLSEPNCLQRVFPVRTDDGTLIVPTGVVADFLYTATLDFPLQVTTGECIWIEIVNISQPNSAGSECSWYWEQSPQGDTRHAITTLPAVVSPGGAGDFPSDYSACNGIGEADPNVAERDLAISLNVRIAKDGCGKPEGRCCYDADILVAGQDCQVTTEEFCEVVLQGEWSEDGTCGPASPACVTGRCCYWDGDSTNCVVTIQSACTAVDGDFVLGSDCSTACPTGKCCVEISPGNVVCNENYSNPQCRAEGGVLWQAGVDCSGPTPCPATLCNDITNFCQGPYLAGATGTEAQGGYVSDLDNLVATADDFRPLNTSGGAENFIDRVCWRGFHKQGNNDCGGGVEVSETFTVTYYNTASNLPSTVKAGPFTVTPTKTAPGESVNGGGVQYQYEATHTAVPLSPNTCYWIEIQQNVTDVSCVFIWGMSNEGGNKRAAVKSDNAQTFPFQHVDRDLAFCVGPMRTGNQICNDSPAIPAPANDACPAAIDLGVGPVAATVGTTFKSTRDANSTVANCVVGQSGNVWYRWTQGGAAVATVFELCGLESSYDSIISVHKTVDDLGNPLPAGGCPGQGATQIAVVAGCNDDGGVDCAAGLGTAQVFFRGRQARLNVTSTALLPANGEFLIQISGASKGAASSNPQEGKFILEITQ